MSEASQFENQGPENGAYRERPQRGALWPMLALLVAAGAVLVALQARRPEPASPWVGLELPPLNVAGWLNTDEPLSAESLRGKVVLVDFWATWCRPCLMGMPELAEFRERFGPRGVVVVGLTADDKSPDAVQEVIDPLDVAWPIGYGARPAFNAVGIYALPTYVLFDRTGRSVWGGHSLQGAEEAAVAALAR